MDDSKKELRRLNRLAWGEGKGEQIKNLDSNIKKNTTFIKKCKTSMGADMRIQLLNDIKKLSLEKYISEVVGAVIQGMAKCKTTADINACVEVVSALHQRFPTSFTLLLTHQLAVVLQPPSKQYLATLNAEQREKEESARIIRQRIYLRLACEFWLVCILRNVQDGISTYSSVDVSGIETQRDSLAGLMGTSNSDLAASSSATHQQQQSQSNNKKQQSGRSSKDAGGFIYKILKDLLANDSERHDNLPLMASFLKNYSQSILGIVPRKQRAAEDKHGEEGKKEAAIEMDKDSVITPDIHAMFTNLFQSYYKSVSEHLVKVHKIVKKMEKQNNEVLFARGGLSDERKERFEKASKVYEKLSTHTQVLSDTLDLDMPELPSIEEMEPKQSILSSNTGSSFNDDGNDTSNSIWEDEDARKFYQDLPDLRALVPDVFLDSDQQSQKKATAVKDENQKVPTENENTKFKEEQQDNGSEVEQQEAVAAKEEELLLEDESIPAPELTEDDLSDPSHIVDEVINKSGVNENEDDETASSSKAITSQNIPLDNLLARLSECANRDLVDSIAVDFCYLNNKVNRRRLVKALLSVQRHRVDLLPYYSRLIAILNRYFPDIGEMTVEALVYEFRGLQRRKTQDLLETRIKNIRFLSELTKFGVAPIHTIFYTFKVALDDFTNQNIDVVCNLLETCGRFLLRTPQTGERMKPMLETVMRKKNVHHLDNRYALMVENAYYQACPPDKPAVCIKERSPIELYIRKLIHEDLCKKTLDRVSKQLRKLHWEDPSIQRILSKIFQKIWKIKFGNIHLMAILASGLNRYHSDFGVQLVDSIVEEIRVGLEQNIFSHNQRRIAIAKYLGELYNYRMIDSPLIFETLYTIVTFGHEFGRPAKERFCPIDAPDDFFRIRLCCTLLDTCGMCFDRGSSRKKLDDFLTFFQMYILSKSKPPMDVDFMISDTLEMLRPQLHLFTTYEEANEAVDRLLMEQLKSVQGTNANNEEGKSSVEDGLDDESDASDLSQSADEDEDEIEIPEDNDDSSNVVGEEDSVVESNKDYTAADDDENVIVLKTKREQQLSKEEEEEFDREFNKLMNESIESRKFDKKQASLDVPIPMNLRGSLDHRSEAAEKSQPNIGKMAFTLLTKKGNRQQTKIMEIPADSTLAISTRNKQEAAREEQQQLKQLVLNYEQREAAAARQAALDEKMRLRGQQRGKKVFQMGAGAAGHSYSAGGGSNW
ncbi:armadillo-type protein [Mycotypha africana]|uniref:armadillo-type protein n=1 Tax=Mycotypha africana TaxID=64632 RepID=UPI00230101AA|nr:armadillo-type protein [Mycotypha africana]KAI8967877.1 armadillo-type protein [Mycotypha africana]